MINFGKKKILDIDIWTCDYEYITHKVLKAIKKNSSLLIFPLATHALVLSKLSKKIRRVLVSADILTPDSYWVKESINLLYGTKLKSRVYGPDLMIKTIALAEVHAIPIYLFGTNKQTLHDLTKNITKNYPRIKIAGKLDAPYSDLFNERYIGLVSKKIEGSNAKIIFVSLSTPKQLIFSELLSKRCTKKLIIIPVGAAFDFLSKNKKQAPKIIQDAGFEWLYRLIQEPRRLWKRYFIYGNMYIILILVQLAKMKYENKD